MNKCLLFFVCISAFSQVKEQKEFFWLAETLIGKEIPNYEIFTGKNPKLGIGFSYYVQQKDSSKSWIKGLQKPRTGISFYFHHFGQKNIGNTYGILPFLETTISTKKRLATKFGLGISYADKKYDAETNPLNDKISTRFNWNLQATLYHDFVFLQKQNLRVGLHFFHHSNGHTKLPNEGINTAMLSLATSLNNKTILPKKEALKPQNNKSLVWFTEVQLGNGFQAFLTPESEVKSVYTSAINGGIFFKDYLKFKFGIGARFYQHYYDYIKDNNLEPYNKNTFQNASNIHVKIGAELVLEHLGINGEFGANLYKPFYKEHYALQTNKSESQYKLKNRFLGRLGLKLYVINNEKNPLNNVYLAAHINSNLGQADFSEISIGYTHRFKKKAYPNKTWF